MITKRLCSWFNLSIALLFLVSLVAISACSPEPEQKQKQKQPVKQTAKQVQKKEDTQEIQSASAKTVWPFGFEKEIEGEVQLETVADKMITRNFVIVFDDSGSMADPDADGNRKIDTAKKAVVEWSKSVPPGANVGLVSFHNGVWLLQPLTAASKEQLISTVQGINQGGRTPLSEAFRKSFLMLTKQGLQQLGYGEYTMVVITDGQASNRTQLNKWVQFVLNNSPIQIYTIGFGIGTDHTLNQPGLTQYKPAENLAELQKGLKEVLAEADTFDETEFK
ncbi:MAG: VWA domain-containing protein [bacterium]|nr:VWA domain-containing protein [bacterium]